MTEQPSDKASASAARPTAARRFLVTGHVQGVFFREWTVGKARELGIGGWVRNRKDGRVEVYAVGKTDILDRFAAKLRAGSPASQVTGVEAEPAEVEKVDGFCRRQSV